MAAIAGVIAWHLATVARRRPWPDAAAYAASRLLPLAFFGSSAVLLRRQHVDMHLHHLYLGWSLALFAELDHWLSAVTLAVGSGIFLQGVGAYSFAPIFQVGSHWDAKQPASMGSGNATVAGPRQWWRGRIGESMLAACLNAEQRRLAACPPPAGCPGPNRCPALACSQFAVGVVLHQRQCVQPALRVPGWEPLHSAVLPGHRPNADPHMHLRLALHACLEPGLQIRVPESRGQPGGASGAALAPVFFQSTQLNVVQRAPCSPAQPPNLCTPDQAAQHPHSARHSSLPVKLQAGTQPACRLRLAPRPYTADGREDAQEIQPLEAAAASQGVAPAID